MTDAQQVLEGEGGRLRCRSPVHLSPCLKSQQGLGSIPVGNIEISGYFEDGKNFFFAQLHTWHSFSLIIHDVWAVTLKSNRSFIGYENSMSNFLTQRKLEDMMEEYFCNYL